MMTIEKNKWLVLLLVVMLALTLAACGDNSDDSNDEGTQEELPEGDLQVTLSIDFPDGTDNEVDDWIMAQPDGSTVLDLLWAYANEHNLTVETDSNDNNYVKTIGSVSAGDNSGWVFTVNDEQINESASQTVLKNGDEVEWEFIDF